MSQTLDTIDLFPAQVRTPRGRHDRARLIVYQGRAYVWTEHNSTVALTEQADVASFTRERNSRAPYMIATSEGEEWECGKGGGCGCGSKLRSLDWKTQIEALQGAAT